MDRSRTQTLFLAAAYERERANAAALPDTPLNELIRLLVEEQLTCAPVAGLLSLHRLALEAADRPGAFVECGVGRGGVLALMAAYAGDRPVWGFDSFEGTPELVPADSGNGALFVGIRWSGALGEKAVVETFRRVGLDLEPVHIVKGWFDESLPAHCAEVGPIALLSVEGDHYAATRSALEGLYGLVVPGGAVVVPAYGSFTGCRRAVDEFRAAYGCADALHTTEGIGEVYWYA